MGKRKLSPEEEKAYAGLARAARRLREAQVRATSKPSGAKNVGTKRTRKGVAHAK